MTRQLLGQPLWFWTFLLLKSCMKIPPLLSLLELLNHWYNSCSQSSGIAKSLAPVLLELPQKMKKTSPTLYSQVLMVDGNGLLHPRGKSFFNFLKMLVITLPDGHAFLHIHDYCSSLSMDFIVMPLFVLTEIIGKSAGFCIGLSSWAVG
ncbi:UNVERIFIED_CONTAM: Endonuclease V [Sesamum indicum]